MPPNIQIALQFDSDKLLTIIGESVIITLTMGSYTPLDINRFQQNASQQKTMGSANASRNISGKSSFLQPLIMISSLLIVFVSGIFFAQRLFAPASLELAQGAEAVPALPVTETLRVGVDPTFPPLEYTDENGDVAGYDIDFVRFLGEELGVIIEFHPLSWDSLFTELDTGSIDMIVSGVSITDERKVRFTFTEPYLNAGQVIITNRADDSILTPQDLSGKRIGVQRATTNEDEAVKYTDPSLVIGYDDFLQAAEALMAGEIDAIISDLPNAMGMVQKYPEIKIASEPFTDDYYGIVLQKGNSELRDRLNAAMAALDQKGIFSSLREKWLH